MVRLLTQNGCPQQPLLSELTRPYPMHSPSLNGSWVRITVYLLLEEGGKSIMLHRGAI